ncbi:beta-lactamase family protein [Streptacidiphilus sp. PB12-B1b]|uniref:serine hydrolase domain-containing protein n=1 Tax=Streptacidiphilus sp. PB12-B1b TaxID=2705012 RepID=UPI0015F836C4|nr:serine hydrolase domain-containing protein [Streptacidiphilus sp. PB12-B1b]QMU75160.1 beta-lactamase family protein [Streptacidiphilus sp. PB12-B1b]
MAARAGRIRELLDGGVIGQVYPGAVWGHGTADGVGDQGVVGVPDPERPERGMRLDTLFDVASLTKILAVWACAGALWQDGLLDVDARLGAYWPEAGPALGAVTARQLLSHTAGVLPRAQLEARYGTDPAAIRAGVLHAELHRPPGTAVEYTDRAALILGYLVEHLAGQPLDQAATARIWAPLGMHRTRFGPLPADLADGCAPTERDPVTGVRLRGTVHDPSARLLGGVSGVAGVFTDLGDLGRFLRHLLDPTASGADPGFGPAWITETFAVHTGELEPARGLFWHPAPGTAPADDIWVHYGFTGTGMWVSPTRRRWAALLTNKVYLTRDRQPLTDIRNAFRALVFAA